MQGASREDERSTRLAGLRADSPSVSSSPVGSANVANGKVLDPPVIVAQVFRREGENHALQGRAGCTRTHLVAESPGGVGRFGPFCKTKHVLEEPPDAVNCPVPDHTIQVAHYAELKSKEAV